MIDLPPGSGLPVIIEPIKTISTQGADGLTTITVIFIGWILLIFICFWISGNPGSMKEPT